MTPTPDHLIATSATLAGWLGVTPQTLRNWTADGMPGKVGHGRFDLTLVMPWLLARARRAAEARTGTLAMERKRLLVEQARGHRLENERKAAELLPREDVLADIRQYESITADVLGRVPDCAVGVVAASGDPAAIRRALGVACRQARLELAERVTEYGQRLADEAPAEPNDEKPRPRPRRNGHGAA